MYVSMPPRVDTYRGLAPSYGSTSPIFGGQAQAQPNMGIDPSGGFMSAQADQGWQPSGTQAQDPRLAGLRGSWMQSPQQGGTSTPGGGLGASGSLSDPNQQALRDYFQHWFGTPGATSQPGSAGQSGWGSGSKDILGSLGPSIAMLAAPPYTGLATSLTNLLMGGDANGRATDMATFPVYDWFTGMGTSQQEAFPNNPFSKWSYDALRAGSDANGTPNSSFMPERDWSTPYGQADNRDSGSPLAAATTPEEMYAALMGESGNTGFLGVPTDRAAFDQWLQNPGAMSLQARPYTAGSTSGAQFSGPDLSGYNSAITSAAQSQAKMVGFLGQVAPMAQASGMDVGTYLASQGAPAELVQAINSLYGHRASERTLGTGRTSMNNFQALNALQQSELLNSNAGGPPA